MQQQDDPAMRQISPWMTQAWSRAVHTCAPADADRLGTALDWHPSEATAMLSATARGIRGACCGYPGVRA